ncbi:hypothetical protein L6278_03165 [Candidatus Parcubacteria bacterium]|nr:hypothetical protein [Patescibacteria group bacterium]MBU4482306.1 hypothetical protein [Patescibacteria group bacterium]MCG2687101.1 hypothetical protein [Candidatus Parcubacteria bacterium]
MQEIHRPQSSRELGIRDARLRQRLTNIEQPVMQSKKSGEERKVIKSAGIILVLIILIAGIWWLIAQNQKYTSNNWQAVFLSDGQVYFGKIIKEDKQNLILENIYYLSEKGSLQQGENNINKIGQDVSLIKLGTELHGPQDQMRINRFHILFIEELKDNSKIVSAIKDYIAK